MHRIFIYLVVGISLTGVRAQELLSVSDAIKIGLANNYNLQVQRQAQKIDEINNTWGNTQAMPNIMFSASGNAKFNYNEAEDFREETLVPELSLNWVLFDGFSARISKEKYELLEQQSKGNTAVLVESTIQDIILAYNNCLLQSEMVGVYEELAMLSKDRYDRAIDSKALGTGSTYETLQAKTAWLQDQSNFLKQKVMYDNAVRTLNFALAVDDNSDWQLVSNLQTNAPDYNLESLLEKMSSSNSTLKNQYLYQSQKAKETALVKSAYFPTLSLNTGVNVNDYNKYFADNGTDLSSNAVNAYAGVTLSWSIFNGGTRKRSIEIAKINEETVAVKTSQMAHSLSNQLLQMYSSYEVNRSIFNLAKEQEATAKLNLELSEEKLKNGSINSFNYRDVQIAYMNAAIAKFSAVFEVIQSNTDLLRITGGIVNEYD